MARSQVLAPFAQVLRVPTIGRAVVVGFLARVPNFGMGVLLTLHIVAHLNPHYSAAGLVAGVFTVSATASGPWRGHLLDRRGLRRTMMPSLVIVGVCVILAPLCTYTELLVLMVPLGVWSFPIFSLLRQVMVANAPMELRSTAMSLDSVTVEFAYMLGPALAVMAASAIDTRVALWLFGGAWVVGSGLLTWLNPPIAVGTAAREPGAGHEPEATRRSWLTPALVALLAALVGAGFVLGGTELATVAGLRSLGMGSAIGWQLAIWGAGSALGGVINGALRRPVPVVVLLAGLGITTMPLALARGPIGFAVLLFITGLFCAPTLAASADLLSRQVDGRFLGQALGWHGSATNAGVSLAPPLVGAVMDAAGWRWGFVATGALGLLGAVLLMGASAVRRRR